MRDVLIHIDRSLSQSLQSQVEAGIIAAIHSGQLPARSAAPSTRGLAKRLGVSRNTVSLAYQTLLDAEVLVSRQRSGFYINDNQQLTDQSNPIVQLNWATRLAKTPSLQRNIVKPAHWREIPYPFIYGQTDPTLFPIAEWRDCVRQAMGRRWLDTWTEDRFSRDDPMLIEHIRRHILPRRGIIAGEDEILITLGAQNAIFLLAGLLVGQSTRVAIEEPGYPDMRNALHLRTNHVAAIPVDQEGMVVDDRLHGMDVVCVTPSHQAPTTVTMSPKRRKALLDMAEVQDFVIIEDDYEFETNYSGPPCPALRSMDPYGRVLYVGSLSKSLTPGLRMGFLVAPKQLIEEARAFRRIVLRHPPGDNQRTVALFLAQGHHDTLVNRLHRTYRERWQTLGDALTNHMPMSVRSPAFGGSSYWIEGHKNLDANRLADTLLGRGVLIEPGEVYFTGQNRPKQFFRLGFSCIATEKIDTGIQILAEAYNEMGE